MGVKMVERAEKIAKIIGEENSQRCGATQGPLHGNPIVQHAQIMQKIIDMRLCGNYIAAHIVIGEKKDWCLICNTSVTQ